MSLSQDKRIRIQRGLPMDVPEKFVEKAKEIISSWVMGKIPSYDGKIEQIAKALYQADQEARGRK